MKIRTDFVTNSSSSSFILNYMKDDTIISNEEAIGMLYKIIKIIIDNLRIMENKIKIESNTLYNYLIKYFKISVTNIQDESEYNNYFEAQEHITSNKIFQKYISNAANSISNQLNIKKDLTIGLTDSYLNYFDIKWLLLVEKDKKLQNCRELYDFSKSTKYLSGWEIKGMVSLFGNYGDISNIIPDNLVKKTQTYENIEEEVSEHDKIIIARNSGEITLDTLILDLCGDGCEDEIDKLVSKHYPYAVLHGDNNDIPEIIKIILVEKLRYACEFY